MSLRSMARLLKQRAATVVVCTSATLAQFPPTVGLAFEDATDLRIEAPSAPLQQSCYWNETGTHGGAVSLEEIEGDAIDGYGYGNVQAQSGESWGYWFSAQGQLDGAFLTLKVTTLVEGSEVIEDKQWAFVEGGIVTHLGTYFETDCLPIEQEFTRRVTQ